MNLNISFGKVVRKHRIKFGYSQEYFANLCGLDRTYIGLLERGKRNPSLKSIFIISRNLEISPGDLIKEVEEEVNNKFDF